MTFLKIKSPLLLIRHMFLHKKNKEIIPLFNILRGFVEKNLEDPIRNKTFVLEYYINGLITSFNFPISIHNQLLCETFLRFLACSESELEYLQRVY